MTEGPVYTQDELAGMDDETLVKVWELTDKGRQYEGVEQDRRRVGREMAFRLSEGGDVQLDGD